MTSTTLVDGPAGSLEVHLRGDGPLVVLVPSLGRGAGDFDQLAAALDDAGYRAASPEPRGIGRSVSALDGLSMADLAADVASVIAACSEDGRGVVVGHAFGNRVARMTATEHPDRVRGVVLLACGGQIPPEPHITRALHACFDTSLSPADHIEAVRTGFFAPGNDPSVWTGGWHPLVALHQGQATAGTPVEHWWEAGSAPVLVVQPRQDLIALPANAHDIVERLGSRAELVEIDGAGHALLPEQPQAVADAVIGWLDRLP